MRKVILILFLCPVFVSSQAYQDFFTMFYNVENMFDTIDNPKKNDNEFLPNSDKKWDTEKYNHKIQQLNRVFSLINKGDLPDVIGLCEIENKTVINDLLGTDFFKKNNYKIIHKESEDFRGIDCALLIDTVKYDLLLFDFIEVKIPDAQRPTRDIVFARIKIKDQILNIFVNHWPSRWGGTEVTEYKRVFAAQVLSDYIENNIDDDGHVLIMGDLNDYHYNKSIKDVLVNDKFVNLVISKDNDSIASYNYNNKWGYLDHMIISKTLIDNSKLHFKNFDVFHKDWMLYEKRSGNKSPSRTYGGKTWYGGFSDHLPVFCVFNFMNKL